MTQNTAVSILSPSAANAPAAKTVTTNGAATNAAAAAATRRDLQRDALQSLVTLARECAAAETEIERKLATAQYQAKKSMDAAVDKAHNKYKALEEAVRAHYAARVEEVDKKFEEARQALELQTKARRHRTNHEHDNVGQDVKQRLDQATWLADSVLEAAEIRVREEHTKAKDRAAKAGEALDGLEERTAKLLLKYGQTPPPVTDVDAGEAPPDPTAAFEADKAAAEGSLAALGSLSAPQLLTGGKPWLVGLLACAAAVAVPQLVNATVEPLILPDAIALGAVLAVMVVGTLLIAAKSRKQVAAAHVPLRKSLESARRDVKWMNEAADTKRELDYEAAVKTRKSEIQSAKEKLNPAVAQAARRRDAQVQAVRTDYAKQLGIIEEQRDNGRGDADEWQRRMLPKLQERSDRHLQSVLDRNEAFVREARRKHDDDRAALEKKWSEGLTHIRAPIGESSRQVNDWTEANWDAWVAPKTFAETVRFGEFQVDLKKVVEAAAPEGKFTLPLPGAFSLPALLAFPRQASLLIHTDRPGRADAIRTLQLIMVRLLTSLPPGRVRFTLIDPVGLGQNFAGFMHLADFDENLVGARIWTDAEQIDQRLADLTEHMETVIQKYLRNEFETIDEYNAQAGELAEPYRVLVITDFPTGFEADALRRLSSIAGTGARCGVYTLISRDTRVPIPSGAHFDDVEHHSVNLVREGDKFLWKDEVFRQFPLTLDAPPPEEALTKILQVVGKHAKDANRVEVPFENITPKEKQIWSLDSSADLSVPVGRMGATRLQSVRFGRGMAQHALVAGKTGSGKSSLLNALITNVALWYSPEQVELYLIDFKKGVEFKTYGTYALPHARAIAVESDREFGLSVLQRIDAELTRRGELYRKLGVQDLASYRQSPDTAPMPRTLLVIDEFQEFFSEDDKLAQEASLLLDRLVRQGRAFGIHVLLGSQTLAGSGGLSRATMGQMAIRVALQCSEADSHLILGDNNAAARLLSRPGEAIYNDVGGLVEGNSPFQVAWLPDEKREEFLKLVQAKAAARDGRWEPPIVFEGNAAAPISKNTQLNRLLEENAWPPATSSAPVAWLGDPVAIKAPTAVPFRRQSGANMLIVGQQEESAMAMFATTVISLAAQTPPGTLQSPGGVTFYVLDGSPADSPLAGVLPGVKGAVPHEVRLVEFRAVPDAIAELAAEIERRRGADGVAGAEVFVLVYGLQRYRALRKGDDDFSFSASDAEKKPDPGKQFAEILKEGPSVGIHVVAWADTPISVERTLDRTMMREFDYRILFQMSANDSSNLIDSPAANKLGMHRALAFSEEQGTMEKFRPYAPPEKAWLERVKAQLAARPTAASPEPVPAP